MSINELHHQFKEIANCIIFTKQKSWFNFGDIQKDAILEEKFNQFIYENFEFLAIYIASEKRNIKLSNGEDVNVWSLLTRFPEYFVNASIPNEKGQYSDNFLVDCVIGIKFVNWFLPQFEVYASQLITSHLLQFHTDVIRGKTPIIWHAVQGEKDQ
jgi:hypothetical protein